MENQHYFASCVFGWAVATTREEALEKCLNQFRTDIKRIVLNRQKEGSPGFYMWSCKVPLPIEAHYSIDWFAPQVDGVTGAQEHYVTYVTVKKHAIWTPTKEEQLWQH